MKDIYSGLLSGEKKLAVIGLGYVGLPIALAFAEKLSVIGFDINRERIDMMKNNIDPSCELDSSEFEGKDISFTADLEDLKEAHFFVVAVPTPVDDHKVPDLGPVLSASTTVGKVLKQGDYVVYESTVYPGCTEEDCLPILEGISGLKMGEDFKLGYSPERINPGDKKHTIKNIIKVVSGSDAEALDNVAKVYELIIDAGVHRASTIKVAEAAKIIENTQRDLNIALMNELSVIFDKMGINTYDVLEAAGTKWNFLRFYPGLVGGHCIGVDPYYLTYKSTELGYRPEVILSGRRINDNMSLYVAKRAIQLMIQADKQLKESRVLMMGITFKENVSDIRNSKVVDLVKELHEFSINVDIVDPYASSEELTHEYGLSLTPASEVRDDYDCVILAVNHKEYAQLGENEFEQMTSERPVIIDIKGILKDRINKFTYWSL